MAGFWGARKREREAALTAADADLAQRAQSGLVQVDERIRTTRDELAFAEAELGPSQTKELREALDAVTEHLREAFQLHQLNHDEIPDTPEELRTRNARIVQLCDWAEELLDHRTGQLEADIARVRQAPEIIAGVRRDAGSLRERIPGARDAIERLAARYSDDAIAQIARSADEAEQLLGFAEHSADVSERRRAAHRPEEANLALETATEAVRRATLLIDGVDDFELEALRAQATLAHVVDDSRGDLVAVRDAPQVPAVTEAADRLRQALSALTPTGSRNDPFGELTRLREANSALDAAIAKARDREQNPPPALALVQHAVDDADHQIGVARSVIQGHRGYIGADARTRLAEAERTRLDITALPGDEDSRAQVLQLARRAGQLAGEALQLAQRDIDSSRPQDPGWGGGYGGGRRGGGGGGDVFGAVLGGALLGGLLGDMFD
ncbi:hypothetical protein [uncultured Microbacterium sp.]|uniref:hypothetical protein n=1 Tax=uncultured Microbacterium sp. TaxID=191216 RepID=UPI0025EF6927|nr:hypothetical protein [uncultured Microbacterium sp.]